MKVYTLGTTLEEITLMQDRSASEEEPCLNENVNCATHSKSDGHVFIGTSKELYEMSKEANLVYDGDINVNAIEFCKIESQQECLAGTLCIPRLSDLCGSKYKMQFFVNRKDIVIVDDTGFSLKLIARIQLNRTRQGQTRERFLYNFLTGIIGRDLDVLNRYEHQIMELDEEVLSDRFQNYKEQSANIRKQLLTLREYYDEFMDLGKQLEEDENHFFSKKNLKYFGTVSDRADRLMNRTVHLIDYMSQIRDSYNQKVSEAQNKNMEFLTIVSTIFFPLTLITGWYGMNFENMPELKAGYPYVIALSLVVVTVIIFIFKKRKII